MKSRESVERIALGIYAPMARMTERPIPLDPTGKKTGLPEPGTAATVNIVEILPGSLRELYGRKHL